MKKTDIIIDGHYLRGGQHVQVDQILGSKVKCGMYIIPINMLEPAPLTKEILEKNGFVSQNVYSDVLETEIYGREDCGCGVSECDAGGYQLETFEAWTIREHDGSPRDWGFFTVNRIVDIRFLHEFQQALRTCKVDLDIVL